MFSEMVTKLVSLRNLSLLGETRKMSKMPGMVALYYHEDILRNLTQSQPKVRDCSRYQF